MGTSSRRSLHVAVLMGGPSAEREVSLSSGRECAAALRAEGYTVTEVDAGPDLTVPVGAAHDVVRFDAGGVVDPDGHGLRFGWDFGDGSEATGAVVRHRYTAPGQYTVTLRAQDQTGLACGVATDTATITAIARN